MDNYDKEFVGHLFKIGFTEESILSTFGAKESSRPDTCTKPNCNCIEVAEKENGGPVKSYPCRAKTPIGEMDKIKSGIYDHRKAWIEPRQNIG